METCAVCVDIEAARVLLAGGMDVVLIGPGTVDRGHEVADLRNSAGDRGAGRLAVFVGDLDDDAVRTAALAMAAEQFCAAVVLVRSPHQARTLIETMRKVSSPRR